MQDTISNKIICKKLIKVGILIIINVIYFTSFKVWEIYSQHHYFRSKENVELKI